MNRTVVIITLVIVKVSAIGSVVMLGKSKWRLNMIGVIPLSGVLPGDFKFATAHVYHFLEWFCLWRRANQASNHFWLVRLNFYQSLGRIPFLVDVVFKSTYTLIPEIYTYYGNAPHIKKFSIVKARPEKTLEYLQVTENPEKLFQSMHEQKEIIFSIFHKRRCNLSSCILFATVAILYCRPYLSCNSFGFSCYEVSHEAVESLRNGIVI